MRTARKPTHNPTQKLTWLIGAMAAIVGWTLAIGAIASASGVSGAKLVNNHPAGLEQLGPVVRSDPAMPLKVTVVPRHSRPGQARPAVSRTTESVVPRISSLAHAGTVRPAFRADAGADEGGRAMAA